jgi:predicted site-specific integrase-resolvase
MLDDLPGTHQDVARLLDVSTSTMNRYMRSGGAPRAVMLALFWETRWGRDLAHTTARNELMWANTHRLSLQRHVEHLERTVQRLQICGDFGSANSPVWHAG